MAQQWYMKYVLTWLGGLIVVALLAYFMMREDKLPDLITSPDVVVVDDLFALAPTQYDQLLYVAIDEALIETLSTFDSRWTQAWFAELVAWVDEALVMQYATWLSTYNILLLKWESVDIEQLRTMWLIATDDEYLSRNIWWTTWIYGTQQSLAWYDWKDEVLSTQPFIKQQQAQLQDAKGQLLFLTNADETVVPGIWQLTQGLQHVGIITTFSAWWADGAVSMYFGDGMVTKATSDFEPLFAEYADEWTILYLEFADLLGFFGIAEADFLWLAPLLLWQYGQAASTLLSQEDYATIYEALQQHVAIIVNPTDALLWVSIDLVFEHTPIFTVLRWLTPVWQTMLGWLMGNEEITLIEDDEEVVFTVTSSLLWIENNQPIAHLLKDNEKAVVTLWSSGSLNSNGWAALDLLYDDASSLVFMLDNGQSQQLTSLWVVGDIQWSGQIGSTFQDGVVVGNVRSNPTDNALVISFSVK